MDEVVVLGYRGMLGTYVYSYLKQQGYNVIGHGRGDTYVLDGNPNTVLINCVGAIPQKYTDADRESYYTLNVQLPRLLENSGSKLIHISTDCVFSGRRGWYTEEDHPDPDTLYGASKFLGEPLGRNSHTIRTSIIGDSSPYGLMGWYLEQPRDGWVNGYTNHHWNGVTCLQLAKEIERLMREGGPPLYHYRSPDKVSKRRLLEQIRMVYGGAAIRPISVGKSVDRSLGSIYDFIAPGLIIQLREMYEYETVS